VHAKLLQFGLKTILAKKKPAQTTKKNKKTKRGGENAADKSTLR